MIFLETGHPILLEFFNERAKAGTEGKPNPADVKLADFDQVEYHMVVSDKTPNTITFSVRLSCYSKISPMGAKQAVSKLYGGMEANKTEEGYDLTLDVPVSKLISDKKLAVSLSEIKRNLMAGPFDNCFKALQSGGASGVNPMIIQYRKKEMICLVPSNDRVLVVFSVDFQDEADRVIAKVFLQEFAEAQRHVSNAPNVTFTREPPNDVTKVKGFKESKNAVGYIMFQVFKSHVEGNKLERATTLFCGFRAYLHYHIKASKSQLHCRMRRRVTLLLKVLNRASPEVASELGSAGYAKANPFARKV